MKKNITLISVLLLIVGLGFMLQSFSRQFLPVNKITDNNVGEFKTLNVDGCMDVILTQGPAAQARMEGDQGLVDKIEFDKKGDELTIKFSDKKIGCSGNKSVKVYLSTPDLENINLAGSGDISATNQITSSGPMSLSVAGSGDMTLQINASKLDANIAGSGDINVEGNADNIDVDISGSGDFIGSKLISQKASVEIAGSGDSYINVATHLGASIAGSGDVIYTGSATDIDSEIAGSGSVKKDKE